MKRLFRATRIITSREEVEVFANTVQEAREAFEDDDEDVKVISGIDDNYEISGPIVEVKN